MYIVYIILTAILAYLIGSVNFAVIFSKSIAKKDVRNFGSGNAGMTNVLRIMGKSLAALTFICDVLKGFLASFAGFLIFGALYKTYQINLFYPLYGGYFCAVFCMVGHFFPLFFEFRGGKAVAMTLGVLIACNYPTAICALCAFLIVTLITKFVSAGSLSAAISLIIFTPIFKMNAFNMFLRNEPFGNTVITTLLISIMSVSIIIKHKDNIKRLLNGTEKPAFKRGAKNKNG